MQQAPMPASGPWFHVHLARHHSGMHLPHPSRANPILKIKTASFCNKRCPPRPDRLAARALGVCKAWALCHIRPAKRVACLSGPLPGVCAAAAERARGACGWNQQGAIGSHCVRAVPCAPHAWAALMPPRVPRHAHPDLQLAPVAARPGGLDPLIRQHLRARIHRWSN